MRWAVALLAAGCAFAQDAPEYPADAYYDSARMEAARRRIRKMHGGQTQYFLQADRFEAQAGADQLLWENQGWIGGDYQKFWFKTEGEFREGGDLEHAEVQGLYSRAISSFFDFQAGVRQDLAPGARRTFGVVGVQGLAPYWFEIDAALFVSDDGDVSGRFEAEYDLRFTQRLILQPRAEVNLAAQEVEELGVTTGLSDFEGGVRLRYELKREFAPYVGVSWVRSRGREGGSAVSVVSGLRLWF